MTDNDRARFFAIEARLTALEAAAKPVTVDRPANTSSTNPDPIQPSHIFQPTIPATPDPETTRTCPMCGEPAMVGGVYCTEHANIRRCCRCHKPAPCDLVRCQCTYEKTAAEIAVEIADNELRWADHAELGTSTFEDYKKARKLRDEYRAAVKREGKS